MADKELIIIGAGGHARAFVDCVQSAGRRISGILDLDYRDRDEKIMGIPVLGSYPAFLSRFDANEAELVVAIGDNHQRQLVYEEISALGFNIPSFVHGSAIVAESVILGSGCFVGAGSIINALASIGLNSIINTGAVIEHETEIGAHCHVGPGVKIAGRVNVGAGTFIGIGASVIDKINIGEDVVVGAGSVVVNDLGSGTRVAGVPARGLA